MLRNSPLDRVSTHVLFSLHMRSPTLDSRTRQYVARASAQTDLLEL